MNTRTTRPPRDFQPLWPVVEPVLINRQPPGWRRARLGSKGWLGKYHCPWRDDEDPSLSVKPDTADDAGAYIDWGTGEQGSMADLARRLDIDPRISTEPAPPRANMRAPGHPRRPAQTTAPHTPPAAGAPTGRTRAPSPATEPHATQSADTIARLGAKYAPTLAGFCAARSLDPDRLRSVWRVRQTTKGSCPALAYPTPLRVTRYKMLAGTGSKYLWAKGGGTATWYGLKEADALPSGPLYIVNGEPSVWACYQSDVRAICLCAGEGIPPSPAQVKELRDAGYTVARVVYDLDDAGRNGAPKVVAALRADGAAGLAAHAYQLPQWLPEGSDVDDLHRHTGDDGLAAALAALPIVQPPTATNSEAATAADEPPTYERVDGTRDLYITRKPPAIYRRRLLGGTVEYEQEYSWCPVPIERVLVEDADAGKRAHYVLDVNGHTERVAWQELENGTAWERFPDCEGTAGSRNISNLHNVVQKFARPLPPIHGYSELGWHEVPLPDDQKLWVYLLPDGRTIPPLPDGDTVRAIDQRQDYLAAYAEVAAVPARASAEDMSAALTLAMLASPRRWFVLLLVGACARALLYGIAPSDTAVIIEGPAAHGKSGAAGYGRSLMVPPRPVHPWPPLITASLSPTNDTISAREAKIAREASWPVLVDDLVIRADATDKEQREAWTALEAIIRPLANATAPRGRMDRNMRERREHRARTLPINTGEGLPDGMPESLYRRLVLLTITPDQGDIDTALLHSDSAACYPAMLAVGHGIVERWAKRINCEGLAPARAELAARHAAYERQIREELEARLQGDIPQMAVSLPSNGAHLLLGLWLVGDYLGRGEEYAGHARGGLCAALMAQIARIEKRDTDDGAGPFTQVMHRFAERVREGAPFGNSTGRFVRRVTAHTESEQEPGAHTKNGDPVPVRLFGWLPADDAPRRDRLTLGYVDPEQRAIYLNHAAMDHLRRIAGDEMTYHTLAASDKALGIAAEREGWILRSSEGPRRAVRVRHRGQLLRAWAISLDRFLGEDEAADAEPTAAAISEGSAR
jgi:hypothetical protein